LFTASDRSARESEGVYGRVKNKILNNLQVYQLCWSELASYQYYYLLLFTFDLRGGESTSMLHPYISSCHTESIPQWNKLPGDVTASQSLTGFRRQL